VSREPGGPSPRLAVALVLAALTATVFPWAGARAQLGVGPDWADGTVEGRLYDGASGEGVAGEQIRLSWVPPTVDSGYPYPWVPEIGAGQTQALFQVTDADGAFRFEGLASGRYSLRSYMPLERPTGPVTVSPMAPRHTIELAVTLGRSLQGAVLGPRGGRVEDSSVALVGAEGDDGENTRWQEGPLVREVRADGTFLLAGLPPGPLWLQAYHEDHGFSPPTRIGGDGDPPWLELTLRQETDRLFSLDREVFGGIGVQVGRSPTGPRIDAVSPGLPADLAGIQAGDVVVEIDGHATRFMSFTEFLMRCRGPVGRELTLRLDRSGQILERELVRVDIR
jgi:hypothetical protein